jgi:hypothetical protein
MRFDTVSDMSTKALKSTPKVKARNLKVPVTGVSAKVTASTALLNQRLATLNAPRMLTPSEIKLLRQSKREIAEFCLKVREKAV